MFCERRLNCAETNAKSWAIPERLGFTRRGKLARGGLYLRRFSGLPLQPQPPQRGGAARTLMLCSVMTGTYDGDRNRN